MKHNINYKGALSAAHLPPLQAGRYAPTCPQEFRSYTLGYAVAYTIFSTQSRVTVALKMREGGIYIALGLYHFLNVKPRSTNN
jgi:hypothetical protein